MHTQHSIIQNINIKRILPWHHSVNGLLFAVRQIISLSNIKSTVTNLCILFVVKVQRTCTSLTVTRRFDPVFYWVLALENRTNGLDGCPESP